MALPAKAGYDVDCNVGWGVLAYARCAASLGGPAGDLLETYIPGKERLSIKALAERTAALAKKFW
jgi:hypothetical protein